MQGPPVNLVLLGLLILFFGLLLRGRSQQPYTGWLLGWILIFCSYVVWEVMPLVPSWKGVMELARVDFLAMGIVSFLLSFFLSGASVKRTLLWSGVVVGPQLVFVNLDVLRMQHARLFQGFALLCGLAAFVAVRRLVPRAWSRRRAVLYGLCVLTVLCILLVLQTHGPSRYMRESVQSPMLLAIAVLYLASSKSRRAVRALGAVGLLLWAEFYLFEDLLLPTSFTVRMLYQFWDIPKYCVGTAMILELFEVSRIRVERMAERYRVLYENLNLLYETHPQPMWVYETASRRILSANATAVKVYGYSLDEWMQLDSSSVELDIEPAAGNSISPFATTKDPAGPESRRALHRHKDGKVVTVLIMERQMVYEGHDARVVLAVDVTEQEKVHQDLFHRAHHDPLTQLPNRELLADRVAQVLARSERDGRCAVLLTIDIDHFKQINDTYGHPVGDECLKLVAARLQSRIRQVDTLARTGGEEFTAIIGGLSRSEDAETIAESLRHLFDMPLLLEGQALSVTVSIGGALFPKDGTAPETLRKHSDDALYRAKRGGRNRCEFHSPTHREATADFAA